MSTENKIKFCKSFLNKYFECLIINIKVFGKEHGVEMCDNMKYLLDNTHCSDIDKEFYTNIDTFIDKMAEVIEKEKNSNKK